MDQSTSNGDRGLAAFKAIRLRKASDEVLAVLVDAIRGGLYRPGDLLPRERDLAAQLEVSRTVVRAAIQDLRDAGVVTVRRGQSGGIAVASIANVADLLLKLQSRTMADLRSILEARRALEIAATVLLGERLTESMAAQLRDLAEQLADLLEAPAEFYDTDVRFHLTVAALCGSEAISDYLRDVFNRLAVIRAQYPVAHVELEEAVENQKELLAAIEDGRPETILPAVDRHLAAFEKVMLGQRLTFMSPDERSTR